MIKLPHAQSGGSTVADPVQLIDVAPTILGALGVAAPKSMTGSSLLAHVPASRLIYSETFFPRIHLGWSELRSVTGDQYHYIDAPHPELYDIKSDAAEKHNVLDAQRRTFVQMRDAMQPHRTAASQPANVDPEEAARLAALGYIGSVRTETSSGPLPDPKEHIGELERMKEAGNLESQHDVRGAMAIYDALLAANPRFTDAWIKRAIARESLGDVRGAIGDYKHAVEIAPELAPGLALSIANLQLRAGDLADAEAHAKLAMPRSPGPAHVLLARVALARHDAATAEQEARSAMADRTREREAAVVLAQVLVESGRLPEALQIADDARSRGGNAVENLEMTRGDILARMQQNAAAEAAFRAELSAFPHNLEAYSKFALLLTTEGRAAEARTLLDAMVHDNPGPEAQRVRAATRKLLQL
jgi:tetratricopeptide (TPR) repeat protein